MSAGFAADAMDLGMRLLSLGQLLLAGPGVGNAGPVRCRACVFGDRTVVSHPARAGQLVCVRGIWSIARTRLFSESSDVSPIVRFFVWRFLPQPPRRSFFSHRQSPHDAGGRRVRDPRNASNTGTLSREGKSDVWRFWTHQLHGIYRRRGKDRSLAGRTVGHGEARASDAENILRPGGV